MSNILEEINAYKKEVVSERKAKVSYKDLESSIHFGREIFSAREFVTNPQLSGVIAEYKRKSPSKGVINDRNGVDEVTQAYVHSGASVLSILTDEKYFGGHDDFLRAARSVNNVPILRKDFIVDEYQLLEAKAMGADMILLIAASLAPKDLFRLAKFAKSLGLEILMEVHNREELDRSLCPELDLVGVNNRDLKRFKTSVQNSYNLVEHIPSDFVKISESGISDPQVVVDLKKVGYQGFLIGETFMKEANPGLACHKFISKIKELEA